MLLPSIEEFWVTAADIVYQPRKTGQIGKNVTDVPKGPGAECRAALANFLALGMSVTCPCDAGPTPVSELLVTNFNRVLDRCWLVSC